MSRCTLRRGRSGRPSAESVAGVGGASARSRSPLETSEIESRAIRGVGWTMAHSVLSIPLAFVANLVVARVLGATGYGEVAYLTTVMTIAAAFVAFGIASGAIQFGAPAHARGDFARVEGLLSKAQGYRLMVVVPVLSVIVLLLGWELGPFVLVIAVVFGVIVPFSLGGIPSGLAIENKSAHAARAAMIGQAVTQIVVVGVVVLVGTAESVWAARLAAVSIAIGIGALALAKPYLRAAIVPSLPRGFPEGFWRFSIPAWAAGLVSLLVVSRTEVIFLAWLSTPTEVGLYALAFGVAGYAFAPAQALSGPMIPAVAALTGVGDTHTLKNAFRRTVRVSAVVTGLLAVVTLPALGAVLVPLYGTQYSGSVRPMLVLGMFGILTATVTPVTAFTLARRAPVRLAIVSGAALVVGAALALVLIPLWGLWGAVIGNGVGASILMFLLLVGEKRALSLGYRELVVLIAPTVVAMAGVACGAGLVLVWEPHWAVGAIVGSVIATATFLLILLSCRLGLLTSDREAVVNRFPKRTRRGARLLLTPLTVQKKKETRPTNRGSK